MPSTTFRAYSPLRGWHDKTDAVAVMARAFAEKLQDVTCVRALSDPEQDDADQVNKFITMILTETDQLVGALISDGCNAGLADDGPWMKGPLLELREFEVPGFDAAAARADFERDQFRHAAE